MHAPMYCLSLCDELVKFNVCWSKFTMFSSSCNPVVACLLFFCFFRVLRPGGCPVPAAGTGTGEIYPLCGDGEGERSVFYAVGMGTGCTNPTGAAPLPSLISLQSLPTTATARSAYSCALFSASCDLFCFVLIFFFTVVLLFYYASDAMAVTTW
jgi:hypothetical protein